MKELDKKIVSAFPGLVVRKDLARAVRGNAIVPSYVLEYLLGQYCATDDETSLMHGIETVRDILAKHYVHRNESGLVRSRIREKGRMRVIDRISVSLNDKADVYEAEFSNLGLKKVLISPDMVKANPKLLLAGIWCIADVEYEYTEERGVSPWLLAKLKPVQLSSFSLEEFVSASRAFKPDEWLDVLVQTTGFNPEQFDRRGKLLLLSRLIPFCERNYNFIELGPKGTGKSHIYSEFSPHGILLSGGEVTVPKLFVNNANGRIGLVGYWDCVAFDEFAGKKRVEKNLVDIMKNYMANKSFSRGVEAIGAEASMAFVGNTSHELEYMLKHADLFCDLPDKFHDSAFLDRIHFYLPGWECGIIRSEMFSRGYGFVVDYLAEILRAMRNLDFSDRYREHFALSENISTRDRDGINKTFSGLMKLLYPSGEATREEMGDLLRFAMEGRKRVKDQLLRLDPTYAAVEFYYSGSDGRVDVQTREERDYPDFYHKARDDEKKFAQEDQAAEWLIDTTIDNTGAERGDGRPEAHISIAENQTGISFTSLFGAYVVDAKRIVLTDPYIRQYYQARNLMDFLEMLARVKKGPLSVHLITEEDEFRGERQLESFSKIQKSGKEAGIDFSWEFDNSGSLHARHIVCDNGWKILLDRGLDIFLPYEMNDAFDFPNRIQELRRCKASEITCIRIDEG